MATIQLQNAPFIRKYFYVTGAFGEQRPNHVHTGLDLAPQGYQGSLYAIDDFTVIRKGYEAGGYGHYFIAANSSGVMYLYAHLDREAPSVGSYYNKHDYIGEAGSSGSSTGVHLHLAMQYGSTWKFSNDINDYINPTVYLDGINNVATYADRYYYDGTPSPSKGTKHKFPWFIYQNNSDF